MIYRQNPLPLSNGSNRAVMIRQVIASLGLALLALMITSCDSKDNSVTENGEVTKEGEIPTFTVLDTGVTYELPIDAILYPDHGMDTASADSLYQLMVIPKGSGIRVFNIFMEGSTPWYAVRVIGGPPSGWKNYGGRTLDSLAILSWISESGGIPGWINHRDIEGLPLRFAPTKDKDTTVSK